MNEYQGIYGFYFDKYGYIHTRLVNVTKFHSANKNIERKHSIEAPNVQRKDVAPWLRFIIIFWSPRVMRTALKFGIAALIMNRYERLGFAIMMLCFAF